MVLTSVRVRIPPTAYFAFVVERYTRIILNFSILIKSVVVDSNIKNQARLLRQHGWGYQRIAKEIGSSVTSVRRWVNDIPCDSRTAYLNSVREVKEGRFPKNKAAVRLRLIEERGMRCESCSLSEWQNLPIMLEMHRKDAGGEYTRDNVVLMCPNCHSQTDTWKRGHLSQRQRSPA